MKPVCFHLGPLTVHWYGVFMAVGFLAGLASWTLLGRKKGRDFNFCADLLFWIMLAGIVGGRLAYVISRPGEFLARPITIFYIHRGGLIYYGGFLAAAAAAVVFARVRRQKPGDFVDFVATSLPLGHFFGRLGCVMNGCCFGKLYDGIFGIRYPLNSGAGWTQYENGLVKSEPIRNLMASFDMHRITETQFTESLANLVKAGAIRAGDAMSLPVYPVQIYESLFNLALYVLLVRAYTRRKHEGSVTALYLMIYPAGRFLLEMLRGDPRMMIGPFSVAQVLSMVIFAAGLGVLWWSMTKGERYGTTEAGS